MGKKVLFVEDDMLLGSLITRGLEEAGMEVLFNNSLINLRPNVISFQPDLILLDLEVGCQNNR